MAVLAIALAVVWLVFGDALRPRQAIETAQVLLLETDTAPASTPISGQALAQASGWIEPDAFAVHVAAQTTGTVLEMHVLSGEAVTNGQVVAKLNAEDSRLVHDKQRHIRDTARKALAIRQAEIELAREKAVRARADLRNADSALAIARDTWRRMASLQPGDLSQTERVAASNRVAQFTAKVEAARAEVAAHAAEVRVQEARREADEVGVARAETDLALAKLHLDRTTVRSPMDGIVLGRLVQPGDALDKANSAIVSLYDPNRLQVRVDVPLADIRHVRVEQPARISSGAFGGDSFNGVVTRITGEADISRNTLQVKVKILDPHPLMRPDMLCRVEFLPSQPGTDFTATGGRALWIPESALLNRSGARAEAWVVDPVRQVVTKATIETRGPARDGLVQVASGVTAGARVVVAGHASLSEGARVKTGDQP